MERENGRMLTKEQVSTEFGVSLRTIDRYIKEGLIIPVKQGKFTRFNETDIKSVKVKIEGGEQK